jgi:hypothetical protein
MRGTTYTGGVREQGAERDEVTGWIKLHNYELRDAYFSPHTVG